MNFQSEQNAKLQQHAQQQYAQQAGNQLMGGGALMTGPTCDTAPPVCVTQIAALLLSQAQELRRRCASVADVISGSIPQSPTKEPNDSTCLIDLLQTVSATMSTALNEIERAQSRI